MIPAQHQAQVLIGEAEVDVKGRIGIIRGYRWGTMTFRTTVEYNHGDTHWDLGENLARVPEASVVGHTPVPRNRRR